MKDKLHEVSLEEILEKQAIQQAQKEETDRLRSYAITVALFMLLTVG